MRIGLFDVDSHNFPNLPLMKLSAWHKSRGDTVNVSGLDERDVAILAELADRLRKSKTED